MSDFVLATLYLMEVIFFGGLAIGFVFLIGGILAGKIRL